MAIPTPEELKDFRKKLNETGLEGVREGLRHHRYGSYTTWHYKEAEAFIAGHEDNESKQAQKRQDKRAEENLSLMHEANDLAKEANDESKAANKLSYIAIWISVAAIVVSILVAIFK